MIPGITNMVENWLYGVALQTLGTKPTRFQIGLNNILGVKNEKLTIATNNKEAV